MKSLDEMTIEAFIPSDMSQVPKLFDEARARSLTTFHLPFRTFDLSPMLGYKQGGDFNDALRRVPFDRFCIIEDGRIHGDLCQLAPKHLKQFVDDDGYVYSNGTLTFELIFDEKTGHMKLSAFSKLVYKGGLVLYTPNEKRHGWELNDNGNIFDTHIEAYFRMYALFKNRNIRYVEQPVSRQYKRALGVQKEYKEYILVPRESVRYYPNLESISRTEMLGRLKRLHPVRGHEREEHLRQLSDGRIVVVSGSYVRPHARGQGEALQVPDYMLLGGNK